MHVRLHVHVRVHVHVHVHRAHTSHAPSLCNLDMLDDLYLHVHVHVHIHVEGQLCA